MADEIVAPGNLCRFCLCQDDLIPFSEAKSSALTFEDVLYYSGIELSADEEFVLCNDCCVSINESANYRRTCLRNESLFERLVQLRNRSTTTSATITSSPVEAASVLGAPFTVVTVAENHTITQDDSNDASSLAQKVKPNEMSDFEDEMETGNIDEETDANVFNESGNESDYSVPSLYGEVMGEVEKKAHKPVKSRTSAATTETVPCLPSSSQKVFLFRGKRARRFQCPYCAFRTTNLTKHIKSKHRIFCKEYSFSCSHCPKRFAQEVSLKVHMKARHDTRPITFTCEECGKGFVTKTGHASHMRFSHGRRGAEYECQECYKKFTSVFAYKEHIKTHSPTATKCEDCGKLFKNMLMLGKHKLKGYCEKRTSTSK